MLIEFTKFYYHALSSEKKRIYRELYDGFKEKRKTIDIHADRTKISAEDIGEIAIHVYNDTPSFYYLDTQMYTWSETHFGYRYAQKYIYSDGQIDVFDRKIKTVVADFRNRYITPGMTEYQRVKAVHDYLVKNTVYDHEALAEGRYVSEAFNVIGALLKRKAVCWGIACGFKLLCDYCQIKSFVVIGDTIPHQENVGHAWNMVKIDEETYHVDATWDIKEKGAISFCYDYFNLDDNLIKMDHTWQSELYPACTAVRQNFYYRNRLYVKSLEELSAYIRRRVQKKEAYIVVKYANNLPPVDAIEQTVHRALSYSTHFHSYRFQCSVKTHNIYIELV